MDISTNINKLLLSLLEEYIKSDDTELEAIIWGANFDDKKINHHSFIDVINFLKNELELTFTNTDSLTIQTNSSSGMAPRQEFVGLMPVIGPIDSDVVQPHDVIDDIARDFAGAWRDSAGHDEDKAMCNDATGSLWRWDAGSVDIVAQ